MSDSRAAPGQEWEVIPLLPLPLGARTSFTYVQPRRTNATETSARLAPGVLVRIPFGRRTVHGMVWKRRGATRTRRLLKAISRILSPSPLFSPAELSLLQTLAELSLEPFPSVLKAATHVREPLVRLAVEHPMNQRVIRPAGFRLDVRHATIADALPTTSSGQHLVLVPEGVIARATLRYLAERSLPAVFFAQTLSLRERRTVIGRPARGESLYIVATHAGVFLPLPQLSSITVLETALPSHRQWDLHPRYDARVAALLLARTRNVPLTLQSTLPSLDLHNLQNNVGVTARGSFALPRAFRILPRSPADPLLLPETRAVLSTTVKTGRSVLLFHDIAGTERLFTCDSCGFVFRCTACGGILERRESLLVCPSCTAREGPVPHFCPRCKSPHVGPRRTGTASLAAELRYAFPRATIVRADRETIPRARAGKFSRLHAGHITVGTERAFAVLEEASIDQVVAVSADRVLASATHDAAERTAILLTRLALLQRRNDVPVIVQTAHAHQPVMRAFSSGTLDDWIAGELTDRRELAYPPFTAVLELERSFPTAARAAATAARLRQKLSANEPGIRIGSRTVDSVKRPRSALHVRGPWRTIRDAQHRIPAGWRLDPHVPLTVAVAALEKLESTRGR